MLVQYCSDLHLEFPANERFLRRKPLMPVGEILLLGGDILPLKYEHTKSDFFNYVADHFEIVYWIPGNHEFYGSNLKNYTNPLNEKIRSNIFLVNNTTVQYKGIDIVCSTLWSHIHPENEFVIERRLTDFAAIQCDGETLTAGLYNEQHRQATRFLQQHLAGIIADKTIVLTHHVPTFKNYPSKYKNSPVNQGFATECHDLIEQSGAAYWLYGHHHFNRPAFKIGKTVLLTNQLGYVSNNEHRKFNRSACLEL